MKKSVEEIEQRLDTPEYKKNILLATHQILQANIHARKMLKQSSDDLDKAIDDLKNAIFAQAVEEPTVTFKTREVYDIIRRQFFGLKKEQEKTLNVKFALQKRIISSQRALAMAQNIFVSGEFKKLRAAIRQYKKDDQKLAKDTITYTQREKLFHTRDWTEEPRDYFLQEQYYLMKQRTLLEMERARLVRLKAFLENRQSELEQLCQQSDSQKKIELIAAGILRKNYKFVQQVEAVDTRINQLRERMDHAKEQMNALKLRLSLDKPSTRYKLTSSDNSSNNSVASIIADAILNDPHAVQLVARSTGNNLETDKSWELMSELDKDEFFQRQMIHYL